MFLGYCSALAIFSFAVSGNPATLSGLEPSVGAQDSKKEAPGPQMGLVLGYGLPSIPADLLQQIRKKQNVELMDLWDWWLTWLVTTLVQLGLRVSRQPGPRQWATLSSSGTSWTRSCAWVLATVKGVHGHGPTLQPASFKAKRPRLDACFKWNEGTCTFCTCQNSHVCSHCLSPHHKVGSCPMAPAKVKKAK